MTLWEPLMFEGRVLLTAGRALHAAEAATLHRRCPDTLVRVADPRLDQAAEFENEIEDGCVAQTVCHRLRSLLAGVFGRFESSEHPQVSENDIGKVRAAVAEVMQYLKFHHVSSLLLPPCTSPATFLTDHLANVMYTSLVFGSSVRSYITSERQRLSKAPLLPKHLSDLSSLALGAAFLDIGMTPLRSLYQTDDPLSPAQRDAVREHCASGSEMMPVSFSSLGRMMIRSHHEKADGTGYPDGIDGSKLHVFLRIAHIADAFNARTSRQVFKEAGSIVSTAWRMSRGAEQYGYDPFLVPIFLDLIRPFPVGSRVQLTDGRGAVVVRHERGQPFHPVVLIAFDDQDRPIDPPKGPIALAGEATLGIHRFEGEDLGYIYNGRKALPLPALAGDSLLATMYGLPELIGSRSADA
jgi:hypothetical protein